MNVPADPARAFLRHTLATLAYRGGKVLRDVPPGFESFRLPEAARTPLLILAHIGDVLDWALSLAKGEQVWQGTEPQSWTAETSRFFEGLRKLDEFLASDAPLGSPGEKLFQGPVADALTHVGQIALLRRQAGWPVKGENYFKAEVVAGRVGGAQASPRREFD
jgi:hypothetical protein